jgi:hypothetical protein
MWWSLCAPATAQKAVPSPADEPATCSAPVPLDPSECAARQAEIEAALARYELEPSVEQVVHEALIAAPTPRAAALAAQARMAGWVPRLGLRARRGQTVDLTSPQSLDTGALRVSSNDDLTLEASLTFDLDRLVFRREEVALLHQSTAEQQARERLVREVIELYFERRRLQLERDLKGDPRLERAVRISEIEALLNAFTNGSFRRMIAKSRWTTDADTPASTSPSSPKSTSATSR